jgi:hypothetical protein
MARVARTSITLARAYLHRVIAGICGKLFKPLRETDCSDRSAHKHYCRERIGSQIEWIFNLDRLCGDPAAVRHEARKR